MSEQRRYLRHFGLFTEGLLGKNAHCFLSRVKAYDVDWHLKRNFISSLCTTEGGSEQTKERRRVWQCNMITVIVNGKESLHIYLQNQLNMVK